jgi:hypothetical protein
MYIYFCLVWVLIDCDYEFGHMLNFILQIIIEWCHNTQYCLQNDAIFIIENV